MRLAAYCEVTVSTIAGAEFFDGEAYVRQTLSKLYCCMMPVLRVELSFGDSLVCCNYGFTFVAQNRQRSAQSQF
jgi:hypothetical protein